MVKFVRVRVRVRVCVCVCVCDLIFLFEIFINLCLVFVPDTPIISLENI